MTHIKMKCDKCGEMYWEFNPNHRFYKHLCLKCIREEMEKAQRWNEKGGAK